MSEFVLWGFDASTYVRTIKMLLAEKHFTQFKQMPLNVLQGEPKRPEHLERHPFGKVPVLDHDGMRILETTAIARYLNDVLPGKSLVPPTPKDRARMDMKSAWSTPTATSPVGQTPQAVVYVPQAIPADTGTGNAAMSVMDRSPPGAETQGLQPLGIAGQTTQLWLEPPGQGETAGEAKAPTSVTLFDQGLVQVLEAAVTGLEPRKPYVLALANEPSGGGALESLQAFMTNPAGSAIVNAIGPIRQVVQGADENPRRYLVIVPGTAEDHGAAVQVQRQ
jgi:hypothetical protein